MADRNDIPLQLEPPRLGALPYDDPRTAAQMIWAWEGRMATWLATLANQLETLLQMLAKQAALTAEDTQTVDGTYGSEEADVIENLRTRVGELEAALQAQDLLS